MPISQVTDIASCEAAFSVRKIVSGYASNCVRLRRSSDSVESDFGFDGDGILDAAAISTWLSGDTGYLVTWYDQSGNGNDATQSDTTKQPVYVASGINSLPTFDFDGSNDYLLANSLAATFSGATKPLSMSTVIRPTLGADYRALFTITRSTSTAYRAPGLIEPTASGSNVLLARRNDSGTLSLPESVGSLASGTDYIITTKLDSGARALLIDGTVHIHPIGATSTVTVNRASIGILHIQSNFFYAYDGYMSEMVVYSAGLTISEAEDLFDYQNDRFVVTTAQTYKANNAASYLTTPTYDGSGQAIHPDIYDSGEGNTTDGYRYWMSMTPYPSSDASKENPSILVSSDGQTWSVPTGLTNPVEGPPGSGNYGDPDLLLAQDGNWYLYWFWNTATDEVRVADSTDGVNWNASSQMLSGADMGSPAIVWDGSQYVLYTLKTSASPNILTRRTSASPNSGWSAASDVTMPERNGRNVWDFNILYDNGTFYGLFVYAVGDNGANAVLYYGESNDGTTWTVDEVALINPSLGGATWDNGITYRAGFVKTDFGFEIWYSAKDAAGAWHTGYTTTISAPRETQTGLQGHGAVMLSGLAMV